MTEPRPEPTPTTPNAFHAHLDICSWCRAHPFALCLAGDTLLRHAVYEIERGFRPMPPPPDRAPPR